MYVCFVVVTFVFVLLLSTFLLPLSRKIRARSFLSMAVKLNAPMASKR